MTPLSGISQSSQVYNGYVEYDIYGMPKKEAELDQVELVGTQTETQAEAQVKEAQEQEEKSVDFAEKKKEQEVDRQVSILRQRERETIAHEQAHMSAGGHLTGAPRYSYTRGPDGKNYITGGEVSIKIPQGRSPQETIQLMNQVIRAALAPANPSPADLSVASKASMIQTKARAELSKAQSQAYKSGSNLMKGKETKNKVDMKM